MSPAAGAGAAVLRWDATAALGSLVMQLCWHAPRSQLCWEGAGGIQLGMVAGTCVAAAAVLAACVAAAAVMAAAALGAQLQLLLSGGGELMP